MPSKLDLHDQRYGILTVEAEAPRVPSGTRWRVRCDCGTVKEVFTVSLRSGNTTSCGCAERGHGRRRHGEAYKTAEYRAWQLMKRRAEHSKGRILVCARWLNSYENFLVDMGRKPFPEASLDRKKSAGHYEPLNCRWASKTEQAQNLRSNRNLTFEGETKCMTQWAREYGVRVSTLAARLGAGWELGRALKTAPAHGTWKRPDGAEGHSPEYRIWKQLRYRCSNPENMNYAEYGARGIRVCARWAKSFTAFLADVGRRPSLAHSLDRENANGPYSPNNCRWATSKTQQRNRRNNRRLTLRGETYCVSEWAERLGINERVVRTRLQRGWTAERALTAEVRSL